MEKKYIFILWSKALFCKERIIEDISKSFVIEKYFYIQWDRNQYKFNLINLYGEKCDNPKEKIFYIGKKPFMIVLVSDKNPNIITKEIRGKTETINKNVYDKKWLYRKWTADNFRIHASLNECETIHDLRVLLGDDYKKMIRNIDNGNIISTNTHRFDEKNENQIHNYLRISKILKDIIKYSWIRILKYIK